MIKSCNNCFYTLPLYNNHVFLSFVKNNYPSTCEKAPFVTFITHTLCNIVG